MKIFRSLSVKLVLIMFGIIAAANALAGVCVLLLANRTNSEPLRWFFMLRAPIPVLILSLIIGTLISAVIGKMVLRPLNSLIGATKRVAKGDFSVQVEAPDDAGEMSELVGSFNEMTKELGSNELFKKDFINSFSHEFKTPIVSIRGFAKQLQRDDLSDAERREYAGIIARESERLANMASNILLLTRLENEEIIAERATYRLDEQLRGAVILFEKQWSEKSLEPELDLRETHVCLNEELINHVWVNLIGNAVKFSNEGGKLGVACKIVDGRVIVEISDTGIGMDAQTQNRIFDRFYQASPSRATEGNGLGLTLVRRIIELCGGAISVKSAPNQGSTFKVELPSA